MLPITIQDWVVQYWPNVICGFLIFQIFFPQGPFFKRLSRSTKFLGVKGDAQPMTAWIIVLALAVFFGALAEYRFEKRHHVTPHHTINSCTIC